MKNSLLQKIYLSAGLGIPVYRNPATDPANVWQTIFTITGGPILITSLTGVRTVAQGPGAATMQFRQNISAPATLTVLDAGTLAVTADLVGTTYAIDGVIGNAIHGGAGGIPMLFGIIPTGLLVGAPAPAVTLIQVTMTVAGATGSTAYNLSYIPLTPNSAVVAA